MILFFLSLAAFTLATIANMVNRNLGDVKRVEKSTSIEYASYSGLQVALHQLSSVSTWPGTGARVNLPQQAEFGYQVWVNSNLSGTTDITDPDGTVIPPKQTYLRSVGTQAGGTLPVTLTAMAGPTKGTIFNYPAFGADSLNIGPNSQVSAVDGSGTPVPGKAPLRTNGIQAGAVNLGSNAYVDGDITVGRTADAAVAIVADPTAGFSGQPFEAGADLQAPTPAVSIDPNAPDITVDGGLQIFWISFLTFRIPIPLPVPEIRTLTPGNYGDVKVGRPTSFISALVLTPGEYNIKSVETEGLLSYIQSTGPVVIHVDGNFTAQAASTTVKSANRIPSDIQFYHVGASGAMTLHNVAGAFVASGAQWDMNLFNSDIVGALMGKSVSLSAVNLKYWTGLDGLVLNDKISGEWRLTGIRRI